jgi:hypothetical protein
MKRSHFGAVCSFLILALPFGQGAGAYSEPIPVDDVRQDGNQQGTAAKPGPSKASFCDVVRNSEKNDRQLIRTRAILIQSLVALADGGEPYLYAPSCDISDIRALVEYDQSYDINSQAQSALEKYLSQDKNRGVGRAEIEFVGRFDKATGSGFGHLDAWRYRFVIMRIESVKAVPKGISWPK